MNEKQALHLAAGISIQMDEYENVDVETFARAVGIILKSEYGHHNFYNFTQSLNAYLYGN